MTPIDPERYAVVLAHLAHFPRARSGEVLRRLRVDRMELDSASERVPGELADAAAAGDTGPMKRFGDAMREEKARLAREQPTVESLGPLDDEAAPSPPEATQPAVQVSPLASEDTAFAPSEVAPSPPAAAPKFVPSYLRETGAEAPSAPTRLKLGAVLPVAAPPAVVRPAVAPPPAVSIHEADDSIEPSVDSTLAPIPSKVAAKPLPFREGRGGPPPTVALQMPTPRDDEGGETLGIAGTIVPTAATPFEEAALERWTVERYAAFVADRRVDPAEQARAAYGIANAAEESALLVHMNKRFGSEPGLLAQWQALVAARLRARGRG